MRDRKEAVWLAPFIVEHWEHAGTRSATNGSAPQFFIVKISGPRGIWPIRAEVIAPGQEADETCSTSDQQLDLEIRDSAFIEIDCPVEDPVPGEYKMRLFIAGQQVADFPFVLA